MQGATLKRLREAMKISQREAAEKIGITHSYLCMLESEKREASLDLARKLAAFYKVGLDKIV